MKIIRRLLCCLFCLSMLLLSPSDAYAEDALTQDCGVINGEELTRRIEEYMEANSISQWGYSVGYCYTATGDTWFYNGDAWYYSASLFKVPLMMQFAERVYEGEITQDTVFYGQDLTTAEERILIDSVTADALLMMQYYGTEKDCRTAYRRYSSLPDDYFSDAFYITSHFTARFMTDVMTTLYSEEERFPNIINCLKQAQRGEYFDATLGDRYEVAQKYGSYEYLHHAAGIIYMPNPIVVVVMTEGKGNYQEVIGDTGKLLAEYTLELDAALEQERLEEEARLEKEAGLVEEAAETPALPAPTQEVKELAPTEAPVKPAGAESRFGLFFAVAVVLLIILLSVIGMGRKKKYRRK